MCWQSPSWSSESLHQLLLQVMHDGLWAEMKMFAKAITSQATLGSEKQGCASTPSLQSPRELRVGRKGGQPSALHHSWTPRDLCAREKEKMHQVYADFPTKKQKSAFLHEIIRINRCISTCTLRPVGQKMRMYFLLVLYLQKGRNRPFS